MPDLFDEAQTARCGTLSRPPKVRLIQKLKRFTAISALIIAGFLVPLLLLEVGLRLFSPQSLALNVSEWHPVYGWRNRPGARGFFQTADYRMDVVINSLGLRYREVTRPKPPRVFRILGLGDSFAMGYGVPADSCFLAVAERGLQARAEHTGGPRVEILNSGVGKWGTAQEYLYLVEEGFGFQPDAVLLAFCVDNDFENNREGQGLRSEGDRLVPVPMPASTVRTLQRITWYVPGYEFLTMHSHLLNFVRIRLSLLEGRAPEREAPPTPEPTPEKKAEEEKEAGIVPNFAFTIRILAEMAQATRQANVPFLVVFIPSYYSCAPEGWEAVAPFDPRPMESAVEGLAAHLDSLGVAVLNPLPLMRDASRKELQYFPADLHLNLTGSRVMGEVLADWIWSQGLIVPGGDS